MADFRELAAKNQRTANLAGKSFTERILEETKLSLNDQTSGVRTYADQMLSLVRNSEDNPTKLRQLLPILAETARLARTSDPTLTPKEKRAVEDIAHSLQIFIKLKTNYLTRAVKAVGNVVRRRVAGALGDGSSQSAIFNAAAKALTYQRERKGDPGAMAQARADLYGTLADRQQTRPSAPAEEFRPEEPIRPTKPKRMPKEEGAGKDGSTLKQVLATETAALTVLKSIYTILHDEREDVIRQREQAERDKDNVTPTRVVNGAPVPTKDKKKSTIFDWITNAFSGIISTVGKLFSSFTPLLGTLGSAVLSTAGIIGKAGLILTTAIATWEAGKWFEQLTRNDDSWWKKGLSFLQDDFGRLVANPKGYFTGDNKEYDASRDAARQREKGKPAPSVSEFATQEMATLGGMLPGATVAPPTAPAAPSQPKPEAPKPMATPPVAPPVAAPTAPPKSDSVSASPKPISLMDRATNVGQSPTKAGKMTTSSEGLAKIQRREGIGPKDKPAGPHYAYWDVDGWAIGHGMRQYKGKDVTADLVISREEEMAEFARQLRDIYEPIINKELKGGQIPQSMYDALVSVAFNSRAAGKKLAGRVARGETLSPSDFLASATVKGKPHAGLQGRRTSEYQQYSAAFVPARPNDARSAVPVAALTRAAMPRTGGTTIIAPSTTVVGTSGKQTKSPTTVVPVPMVTENPDSTIRGMRSVSGM